MATSGSPRPSQLALGVASGIALSSSSARDVEGLQEVIAEEAEDEILPRVERVLAESFDFVEVFCGAAAPLSTACGRRGLRVGPLIDISVDPLWDLTSRRVCEWIIWLIQKRRARGAHFAPPSGTFSPACRPPRRSSSSPWGLNVDDDKVKGENVWLQAIVLAMRACRAARWGWVSLEHPAASLIWDIPQVREFARGQGWAHASVQLGHTLCYLGGIGCLFLSEIDGFGSGSAAPASLGGSGPRAAPPGEVRGIGLRDCCWGAAEGQVANPSWLPGG